MCVRECVWLYVHGSEHSACLNVRRLQLLEPIQGFRGDRTTQRDNQRQAHAARREDINTGTAGQGAKEGRASHAGRKMKRKVEGRDVTTGRRGKTKEEELVNNNKQ
ncbi:hypothetical protein XENORESO_019212 [Xenotaenia resolanae]|uniref:Uncharacterized protein n=1 Tax=Xenotaenia resolanae TaxID=208358 RepID=A0ABV0X1E9_9TELE